MSGREVRRHLSRRVLALVVLAVSGFTLAVVLARPQSITIVVGEGEPIVVNSPLIWSQWDAALLVASSIVLGSSLGYLVTKKVREPPAPPDVPKTELPSVRVALSSLPSEQGIVLRAVARYEGSILQKDLPSETGFSPAKVSRLLQRMEEKGVVEREQHGNTKKVELSSLMTT